MDSKIDQLLQALDRAAQAAEALKTHITDKDEAGIALDRADLSRAMLGAIELHTLIVRDLKK